MRIAYSSLVMNALPNTAKLPVKIQARRVMLTRYDGQTYILHPQTGKRWNPPIHGYICRVFNDCVQVALTVHRATFNGEPFFFALHHGTRPCVKPVDCGNLWAGCFFVPVEDAGDNPYGFIPEANAHDTTSVPESYWGPFRHNI
jgi:hypothetical protein